MKAEKITRKPVTGTLRRLSLGETVEFPAEQTMSVRGISSQVGFQWGRKFETAINRERKVLEVTRVE